MKNIVGKIIIFNYQMEDFINILLCNDYYVELQKYDNEKLQITIYKYGINKESEEINYEF